MATPPLIHFAGLVRAGVPASCAPHRARRHNVMQHKQYPPLSADTISLAAHQKQLTTSTAKARLIVGNGFESRLFTGWVFDALSQAINDSGLSSYGGLRLNCAGWRYLIRSVLLTFRSRCTAPSSWRNGLLQQDDALYWRTR
jgi:hypothetical protein